MPLLNRRQWLAMGVAACTNAIVMPPAHAKGRYTQLLATWRDGAVERAGVIQVTARGDLLESQVLHQLDLPGRAHGLLAQPDGSVFILARRPGDWLLRWHPEGGRTSWHWLKADKRLNGHAQMRDDGLLLTTETDLDQGQGWIGLRDLAHDVAVAHWPSHGLDPHELLRLPQAVGGFAAGTLMVANGGIPTRAETGRQKQLRQGMDASLVAMDPQTGQLLGQWRLEDDRLSIRHLAWDAATQQLGVALQAEHDDPKTRMAAPVLAIWNGDNLRPAEGAPLSGYGGSICARPGGGFVVSCPRADCVAAFDGFGRHLADADGPEACALASDAKRVWFATRTHIARAERLAQTPHVGAAALPGTGIQIDNHWLML
jgi:hypothetical protein